MAILCLKNEFMERNFNWKHETKKFDIEKKTFIFHSIFVRALELFMLRR